ncbi:MAG: hypothetical protein JWM25_1569 [Thermoleophilia bacterium]|nr:hypothetical protein [Thermoleophilia bacterium]MCZ4496984.1 hypothetical protein [Thermoleophilia bacterium]
MTSRPRIAREAGFTLVELIVVMIIVLVLMAAAWVAMQGAKTSARARATVTSATTVGRAISTFNRQYPVVGSPAVDPLLTRGGGAPFTQAQSEPNGLFSPGGEALLRPWPTNPYTNNPVVITRATAAGCPTTGAFGSIAVCRVPAAQGGAASFRIRAFAKNSSGAAYVVYDVQLA